MDWADKPPLLTSLWVKSGWPTTTSALASLTVGMLLKMRMRQLYQSAMKSLPLSTCAACGVYRVLAPGGAVGLTFWLCRLLVKSGWPTTTSAPAKLDVGTALKISTR